MAYYIFTEAGSYNKQEVLSKMSSCEKEELEKKIYTQFESEIKAAGGNRVKIEWVKELPKDGWRKFLGKIQSISVWLFRTAQVCVLFLVGMPQAVENYKTYFPDSYEYIAEITRDIQYSLQGENKEKVMPIVHTSNKFLLFTNYAVNGKYLNSEHDLSSFRYKRRYGATVGSTVATYIEDARLTTWEKQRPAGVAIISGTCVSTVTTYNLLA